MTNLIESGRASRHAGAQLHQQSRSALWAAREPAAGLTLSEIPDLPARCRGCGAAHCPCGWPEVVMGGEADDTEGGETS